MKGIFGIRTILPVTSTKTKNPQKLTNKNQISVPKNVNLSNYKNSMYVHTKTYSNNSG